MGGLNFCGSKLLLTHFLLLKICSDQKFVWTKFFFLFDLNVFGQIFLYQPQIFLDPKHFGPKIFWTRNFFGLKFCLTKIYFALTIFVIKFLDRKFFRPKLETLLSQNLFGLKNFFDLLFLLDLKIFGNHNFFDQQFFVEFIKTKKNLFWTKYLTYWPDITYMQQQSKNSFNGF